jgi:PIN domain nuclease of toxin-antitoxin system
VNLLLDTHALIWWRSEPSRLGRTARHAISSADVVLVSAASAWEVAIKTALGKLRLPGPFEAAVEESGFRKLPVAFAHAAAVATLPPLHADPFDRMLIAQAIVEGCTVVTGDAQFERYNVPVMRALAD